VQHSRRLSVFIVCETTPPLSLLRHFAVKAIAVELTDLFKLAGCRILDPEANA